MFNGPMVRALLEGRKTVTRRPVKGGQIPRLEYPDSAESWVAVGQHHPRYGFVVHGKTEEECAAKVGELGACPFGQPRDRLWVRETFMDLRGTGVEHRPTPDSATPMPQNARQVRSLMRRARTSA